MADWAGEFGNEYTQRNMFLPDRGEFFERLVTRGVKTAFEIGCNWGPNLQALESVGIEAQGCDINLGAVKVANAMGLKAYHAMSQETNEKFDLSYTVGVLIHQRTPEMIQMMKELVRLSSKYVLMMEYEGTDEEVPYRGERFALFKREYGKIFQSLFPGALLVESGFAGKEKGFDNVTYWLYDISDCTSEDWLASATWESSQESEEPDITGSFAHTLEQVGAY